MFLLTRDNFLNHCLMKPFVICQFDMFTFVVPHTIIFSVNRGEPEFWICGEGSQKEGGRAEFLKGGTKVG